MNELTTSRTLLKILLLLPLLALGALPLRADGNFERKLNTSNHPDLYVTTGAGSIRIFSGSNDHEIQVRAQVKAANNHNRGDVQARIDAILRNPPISQVGDAVHIGEHEDSRLYKDIAVEYQIVVPFHVALNLNSGSGNIEVDHTARFVAANTGSGSIRAHGLHGSAELRTASGDIELEQEGLRGAGYESTACDATHGSVEDHDGRYTLSTGTLCHLPAGSVRTQTGSGSIRLHGLAGQVEARTGSGDIEIDGLIRGGECQTGSGSIHLHANEGSRFDLDASTGSGVVRVHLPGVDTSEGSQAARAAVNGGGARLLVHTGSGDIEVNRHG